MVFKSLLCWKELLDLEGKRTQSYKGGKPKQQRIIYYTFFCELLLCCTYWLNSFFFIIITIDSAILASNSWAVSIRDLFHLGQKGSRCCSFVRMAHWRGSATLNGTLPSWIYFATASTGIFLSMWLLWKMSLYVKKDIYTTVWNCPVHDRMIWPNIHSPESRLTPAVFCDY